MKYFIYYLLVILRVVLKVGTIALVILSLINFFNEEYYVAIYQLLMAVLNDNLLKD